MMLLELAQTFDKTDPADFDARLEIADEMKKLLRDRYAEFDDRHERLTETNPVHPSPAVAVLREMGLADDPMSDDALRGHIEEVNRRPPSPPLDWRAGTQGPPKLPVWSIDFFVDRETVRALLFCTVEQAARENLSPAALGQRVADALFFMIADGPEIPRDESPIQIAARYLERSQPAQSPAAEAGAEGAGDEPAVPDPEQVPLSPPGPGQLPGVFRLA